MYLLGGEQEESDRTPTYHQSGLETSLSSPTTRSAFLKTAVREVQLRGGGIRAAKQSIISVWQAQHSTPTGNSDLEAVRASEGDFRRVI